MNIEATKRSLNNLIESDYETTQMDIFYRKQVALQIFKLSNIVNWEIHPPIENIGQEGILLQLAFNSNKRNNKSNYNRFIQHPMSKLFKYVDEEWAKCFYYSIELPIDISSTSETVVDLLKHTYKPNWFRPFKILVRAF